MYKLLVQRQCAFPSIAYSAWISRKGATRLIAYGEIEDVAHNVGGFAHGLDAVDAHRPAVVVLIEVGYAHILLQISQDASESRRLIVGRVFRRHEKHCHVPLLQHDFLNAETAGKPAQRDHKNQLARLVGNSSETVFKPLAEGIDILLPLHVVEFLVQEYALALLRHVGCRKEDFEVALDGAVVGIFGVGGVLMLVGEGVGKFLRLQFKHRFFENFLIRLIAEVGDKAALLGSEQVSGAADVEVLHGDMYAAAGDAPPV